MTSTKVMPLRSHLPGPFRTELVNPLHARRFAEGCGKVANNDRVDARMPAVYGRCHDLCNTQPASLKFVILRHRNSVSD